MSLVSSGSREMLTPSLNLDRLKIDKSSIIQYGNGIVTSSKESLKQKEEGFKNESLHRHPKVCIKLRSDAETQNSKVLSYRPREKPAILEQNDNYKYYPKSKPTMEATEQHEKSKEKYQIMVQSVIQRKEAIKLVEESHNNGQNKWNLRGQSHNNSFQAGGSTRQSFEYHPKNQALTFGLADSHIQASKPSINLALKNSAVLESRIHNLPDTVSYVVTNLDSKLAEKDSAQSILERQKAPYKNYLDSIISENDKLIEKIGKRLQAKEHAKVIPPSVKASNSTYIRSSFLRPQDSKQTRPNKTFEKENSKLKQTSSFHYDPHVQYQKSEPRNRWLESRSVEGSYGLGKQASNGKSFDLSNSVQPQVINSLQQRRALAKFLKKIK